jgi:hypothetical protein
MELDLRLVCDHCCAFRPFVARAPVRSAGELRLHPELGPFVVEHEDCRPALRIADPEDASIEHYREHYEEA